MKTKGEPKPVVSGRKGNVGGISTPGRHGMKQGLTMLVKPGPATKHTAAVSNLIRPEGSVHIDAGNLKPRGSAPKMVAGSPKHIAGSGHKGIHVGTRPEGPIKRDAAKVVKV